MPTFSSGCGFYSAAALFVIQIAVLATAIPSVRSSVGPSHAGTLSRRMEIGSCGLHGEVAKRSSFMTPRMVGGDVPFHVKFALKVAHLPLLETPSLTNICL